MSRLASRNFYLKFERLERSNANSKYVTLGIRPASTRSRVEATLCYILAKENENFRKLHLSDIVVRHDIVLLMRLAIPSAID